MQNCRQLSDLGNTPYYKPGTCVDNAVHLINEDAKRKMFMEMTTSCFECGYTKRIKVILPPEKLKIIDPRVKKVYDFELSCTKEIDHQYQQLPKYSCNEGHRAVGTCKTCIHCREMIDAECKLNITNMHEYIRLVKCNRTTWSCKPGTYYRSYFTCKFYEKKEE